MAIKMRNNTKSDAVCCEYGERQDQVLNMFDLRIGGNIMMICDVCKGCRKSASGFTWGYL